jgi:outer membrane protein TolC
MNKRLSSQFVLLSSCVLLTLPLLSGCTPSDYKAQADETVYQIIDEKWQADYGSKANFKISDVAPDAEDLQVEKVIPESGILSLRQAVEIATVYNRQYQLEKELLYISALDLRLARHAFEPFLFGGYGAEYVKDGANESVSHGPFIGFNQLLAGGTLITTTVTSAWQKILLGDASGGYVTFLDAAITQPLLRGSGSRIVLETLTQAERDTIYQIRSFNRFRQSLAVDVMSRYYFLLLDLERFRNAEHNVDVLVILNDQTEKLTAAGRLPRYELDRVRQDLLEAENIRIQAREDYHQRLDEFKLFLSLPITAEFTVDLSELADLEIINPEALNFPHFSKVPRDQELTEVPLSTVEGQVEQVDCSGSSTIQNAQVHASADTPAEAAGEDIEYSEAEAIETALALRLDLANMDDAILDATRKIVVAEDRLRAEMNLTGAVSTSTRGSDDTAALVGLELDLPLDRMAEANDYRKALITLTQTQRDYEQAMDTVALEVRSAYRRLVESAKRRRVQVESYELAQKRYENTLHLMQYGRVSSRRVLDAQEALFDAQNAAAEALVVHTIAMLEFYRDTGVLQVRPDGMWEY